MTSNAQLKANGENAKKSTGPKTASGKKRSRKNALRHGLLSEHFFADGDEQKEFTALLGELQTNLNPVGPLEVALLERIAIGLWRQRRLNIAEGAMIRLNRREENLEHQVMAYVPPNGRLFPREGLDYTEFRGQEAKAEKTAKWVVDLRKEIAALSDPTLETIKQSAPNIYSHLERKAKQEELSPEDYLDKVANGVEEFIKTLTMDCVATMKHIKEARADAAFKHDFRMTAFLPDKSDLLARYQTMIDNQLYKVLQEYHQLQDRRLKTIELAVETVPANSVKNGKVE